jgi:hypothetical protein
MYTTHPPIHTGPHSPPMHAGLVQVVGTFISAVVFGVGTYLLVVIGVISKSHMGGSPFVECLMYGKPTVAVWCVCVGGGGGCGGSRGGGGGGVGGKAVAVDGCTGVGLPILPPSPTIALPRLCRWPLP